MPLDSEGKNNDAADVTPALPTRSIPETRPVDKQTVESVEVNEIQEDDAAIVKQYRVKAVLDDSLSCKEFDGFNEFGSTILIAKPYQLRKTPFDGKTVGDYTYEYESNTKRMRVSTEPVCKITEEIQPPYNLDVDIIYAIEVSNTGVDATSAVDLNADGRTWAADDFLRTVKVTSEANDYLETVDINDSEVTYTVAKPFDLRVTPFDGQTIEGVAYTYQTENVRSSFVSGDDPETLTERIIPRYTANFSLIQIRLVKEGTGVTVDDEELVWLDTNVGGRAYAADPPEE